MDGCAGCDGFSAAGAERGFKDDRVGYDRAVRGALEKTEPMTGFWLDAGQFPRSFPFDGVVHR